VLSSLGRDTLSEQRTFNPVDIDIHNELLREFYINRVDTKEVLTFFAVLVNTMQAYDYNFGPHKKNNFMKHTYPFRLVKGFYPNTSIMFRCILIDRSKNIGHPHNPYLQVNSHLPMYAKITKATYKLPKKSRNYITLDHQHSRRLLDDEADSILLGGIVKTVDDITMKFKAPRCVSPKGMPLFNLKRKSVK
jgi:hypothetical protein